MHEQNRARVGPGSDRFGLIVKSGLSDFLAELRASFSTSGLGRSVLRNSTGRKAKNRPSSEQ